jgi:anthranilate synthase component 1
MDALRAMAMGWELVSEPHRLVLPTIGAFAFDFVEFYEPLPEAPSDLGDFPDFVFWLPESLLLLDHERGVLTAVAHVFGGENSRVSYNDAIARLEEMLAASKEVASLDTPGELVACSTAMKADAPPYEVDVSDALFAGHVSELKEKIVDGEIFQVVPSRTFFTPCSDSLAAYRMLRLSNPSPYMFHLAADDFELFGASPETCIAVEQNEQKRIVQIRPIAGTRSRGFDANGTPDSDLDSRLEVELRTDTKELAEHMMLVDLARNDIARVSKPGTREVARLLSVDRYQHVMHLVSSVRGELRDDLDALHAYVACMNMGTLTGAPKVRAAQLLREIEGGRRGPYGGAIGYVTHDGEMDSAIIIRSALVRDGIAHIRAGAGVVHDSHPESEARETFKKARSVLGAIEASRRTSPGGSR